MRYDAASGGMSRWRFFLCFVGIWHALGVHDFSTYHCNLLQHGNNGGECSKQPERCPNAVLFSLISQPHSFPTRWPYAHPGCRRPREHSVLSRGTGNRW